MTEGGGEGTKPAAKAKTENGQLEQWQIQNLRFGGVHLPSPSYSPPFFFFSPFFPLLVPLLSMEFLGRWLEPPTPRWIHP